MRKKHFLLLLVAVLALGILGGTWAYYKNAANVANRISTKESGITMREVFNPADKWLAGETKEKKVSFSNSGELPQVIRFKYESAWSNNLGNTLPELTAQPTIELADTDNWQLINGWYYYKKVLQPNDVTNDVIRSVKFDKSLTNGGYDGKADYSDKCYTLKVTLESLNVSNTDAEAGWNMSFTNSGGTLAWSAK